MCTIAIAREQFPDAPLVVGANREERFDRPSRQPEILGEDVAVLAPRDLRAGGTWIGINECGLFAALTNASGGPEPTRSRGLLLRDVLTARDHEAALGTVDRTLDDDAYAGFHLVITTPGAATLVSWDGERTDRSLPPGLHVVTNGGHHETDPKASVVHSRLLSAVHDEAATYRNRLRTVLADHAIPTCVHGDVRGTRSSSIVTCGEDGAVRWACADGQPCMTPYRTVHNGNFKRDSSQTTEQ